MTRPTIAEINCKRYYLLTSTFSLQELKEMPKEVYKNLCERINTVLEKEGIFTQINIRELYASILQEQAPLYLSQK
jgi:hypothetical protein